MVLSLGSLFHTKGQTQEEPTRWTSVQQERSFRNMGVHLPETEKGQLHAEVVV